MTTSNSMNERRELQLDENTPFIHQLGNDVIAEFEKQDVANYWGTIIHNVDSGNDYELVITRIGCETPMMQNERLRKELNETNKWQPIETAPKDGTPLLLYTTCGIVECFWRRDGWEQMPCFSSYDESCVGLSSKPTHWMPLPPPPNRAL